MTDPLPPPFAPGQHVRVTIDDADFAFDEVVDVLREWARTRLKVHLQSLVDGTQAKLRRPLAITVSEDGMVDVFLDGRENETLDCAIIVYNRAYDYPTAREKRLRRSYRELDEFFRLVCRMQDEQFCYALKAEWVSGEWTASRIGTPRRIEELP